MRIFDCANSSLFRKVIQEVQNHLSHHSNSLHQVPKHFSQFAGSLPRTMASCRVVSCLLFLIALQCMTVSGDFLSPFLPRVLDDVCKHVECGKGACKPSQNSSFFYECECDAGWKQTRSEKDDFLGFLPCIVPNCTMDFSCMAAAPSPVQFKTKKANDTIFDPCFWTDCGGGSCNKASNVSYSCACAEGYHNLLNVSAFPCYRECEIGVDCSKLGIPTSNKSTAPTTAIAASDESQADSFLQSNFSWLLLLVVSMAMI